MQTLLELVQEAPLYRRSAQDIALGRRPVVIYCHHAEWGAALDAFSTAAGGPPTCFCFHDKPADTSDVRGAPVIARAELAQRQELLPWVYGKSERAKGIVLAQNGVLDFVFAKDPAYKDTRYQPDLWATRRAELERVYAMLADDESRRTLASIVKQRLRGEHGFLRIARYPEYSHPVVMAKPGNTVIDAGAFDGRTSLAFALQATGGRVFAFEPDPTNIATVQKALDDARASGDERRARAASIVTIAPFALFNEETTLRFSGAKKGSSAIMATGADGIDVQAISLDRYVERESLPRVDLISIDVEGAEEAVLQGMRETIRRCRPKLQVSIYHRKEHLYVLPFLVESLCENYTYFLGHHNTYSTETDLYAVPTEGCLPAKA